MDKVHDVMDSFNNLCIKVSDILECRVDNVLLSISNTSLCDAPLEPITIDEFTKITEDTVAKSTSTVSKYKILHFEIN
jgi:hypothetical protein